MRDEAVNSRRQEFSSEEESENEDYEILGEDYSSFFVRAIYMNFDGTSIGPTSDLIPINYFAMKRDITDLDIYPLKFHHASDEILDRLLARGKRFLSCQGHRSYDGMTARRYGSKRDLVELEGEIYVDFKTGYRDLGNRHKPPITKSALEVLVLGGGTDDLEPYRPTYALDDPRRQLVQIQEDQSVDRRLALQVLSSQSDSLRTILAEEAETTEEYLQLLPYQVLAYVFRSRKWCK